MRGPIVAGLLMGLLASASDQPALAAESTLEARILHEMADGLYVDAGSNRGVKVGDNGMALHNGAEAARVEVTAVNLRSSLVRVMAWTSSERLLPGDIVRITTTGVSEADRGADGQGSGEKPSTLKPQTDDKGEFVPLLAPPVKSVALAADPANAFHGRVWLRQLYQMDSKSSQDYAFTRVGSSGSIERIEGGRWTLEWSGALSYRTGSAFDGSRNDAEIRPDLFRFSLTRSFESGALLRLGRFLPPELPAVGYLDGAQGEALLNGHLRIGGMLGLKPTRRDLGVSVREPTAVAYATVEAGERESLRYSGTAGVLGSLYDGKPDRLALFLDQRLGVSRWLWLYSTTEADVDIGGADVRNGIRLTREDLYATVPVAPWLELRAGLDHYERPDTEAERDILRVPTDQIFDNGYWRYWSGATLRLPLGLELGGEAGYINSPGDDGVHWRASAAKMGLFSWSNASVRATIYNLLGADADGYGGRFGAYLPLRNSTIFVEPSAGIRLLGTDQTSQDFELTDVALRAYWQATSSWSLDAGITYMTGTAVEAWLVDIGVSFRW